jgi:hypothetical protein
MARAPLGETAALDVDAVAPGAAACLAGRRVEATSVFGFGAAGFALAARGASTVTGGNVADAVCALASEEMTEGIAQSTHRLARRKAR